MHTRLREHLHALHTSPYEPLPQLANYIQNNFWAEEAPACAAHQSRIAGAAACKLDPHQLACLIL